jgi:hypothetical protein
VLKLIYCPTDDMVVDALTKALPRWKVVVHALGNCTKTLQLLDFFKFKS